MLPNFLIVGGMKCGTSSLANYLDEHPDVFCAPKHEIQFFDHPDRNYARGVEWYEGFFSDHRGERAIGEKSTEYMLYPDTPRLIAGMLKQVRLLFVLRDPVERAFSHYRHQVARGREQLSFEEALEAESERCTDIFKEQTYGYTSRGFYMDQIRRFMEHFGREQMHFVLNEDLKTRVFDAMTEILEFLGVDPAFRSEAWTVRHNVNDFTRPRVKAASRATGLRRVARALLPRSARDRLRRANKIPIDHEMKPETREMLQGRFREANQALAEILCRNLDAWNAGASEGKQTEVL